MTSGDSLYAAPGVKVSEINDTIEIMKYMADNKAAISSLTDTLYEARRSYKRTGVDLGSGWAAKINREIGWRKSLSGALEIRRQVIARQNKDQKASAFIEKRRLTMELSSLRRKTLVKVFSELFPEEFAVVQKACDDRYPDIFQGKA